MGSPGLHPRPIDWILQYTTLCNKSFNVIVEQFYPIYEAITIAKEGKCFVKESP